MPIPRSNSVLREVPTDSIGRTAPAPGIPIQVAAREEFAPRDAATPHLKQIRMAYPVRLAPERLDYIFRGLIVPLHDRACLRIPLGREILYSDLWFFWFRCVGHFGFHGVVMFDSISS